MQSCRLLADVALRYKLYEDSHLSELYVCIDVKRVWDEKVSAFFALPWAHVTVGSYKIQTSTHKGCKTYEGCMERMRKAMRDCELLLKVRSSTLRPSADYGPRPPVQKAWLRLQLNTECPIDGVDHPVVFELLRSDPSWPVMDIAKIALCIDAKLAGMFERTHRQRNMCYEFGPTLHLSIYDSITTDQPTALLLLG